MTVSVLLVDDQDMVRAGFRLLLEAEPDVDVIGEARDGRQAIDETRRLRPDVVLMDIQMPGMDGIEATRELSLADDPARVMMLTTFERDDYVFEALRAGASGFLLKNAPPEDLVEAIHVVAGGDALLAPSITRRVCEQFASQGIVPSRVHELDGLTEREREVLVLISRGLSNGEIAQRLFLGEATVKTHVSRTLAKLGLRDRVQAVVMAYETGLVRPGTS